VSFVAYHRVQLLIKRATLLMSYDSGGKGARHRRSEHPHPVDIYVGGRVRERRQHLGLSQEKLGEAIGLTFQQVQKYERGANRIGASRLYELSRVLDVPVGFFFDGIKHEIAGQMGLGEAPAAAFSAPTLDRENLELVRLYQRISDTAVRRRIFDLAKAIADAYFPADPS
jgi:transcriptional regulator with XRE-family HTH domain